MATIYGPNFQVWNQHPKNASQQFAPLSLNYLQHRYVTKYGCAADRCCIVGLGGHYVISGASAAGMTPCDVMWVECRTWMGRKSLSNKISFYLSSRRKDGWRKITRVLPGLRMSCSELVNVSHARLTGFFRPRNCAISSGRPVVCAQSTPASADACGIRGLRTRKLFHSGLNMDQILRSAEL